MKIIDDFSEDIIESINVTDEIKVSGFNSIDQIQKGQIGFCLNKKFLEQALKTEATALIVSPDQIEGVSVPSKALIVCPLPELLTAKILSKYFYKKPSFLKQIEKEYYVSSKAIIHPTVKLPKKVYIDDFTIVESGVQLDEGVYIGPQCIIQENAVIGENTILGPQVLVGSNVKIGKQCIFQGQSILGSSDSKHFHLADWSKLDSNGALIIEDQVEVGAQCLIEKGIYKPTSISKGTKLDNQICILSDAQIGKHCMITACVSIHGFTEIGDYCAFGGNTVVLPGVKITSKCQFAGVSRVAEDVLESGVYGGEALQPLKDYLRTLSILPKLPDLNKKLKSL